MLWGYDGPVTVSFVSYSNSIWSCDTFASGRATTGQRLALSFKVSLRFYQSLKLFKKRLGKQHCNKIDSFPLFSSCLFILQGFCLFHYLVFRLFFFLQYVLSLPLLGKHPKDCVSYHRDTCTFICVYCYFIIVVRKWNQHICPSTDERVMKMWW